MPTITCAISNDQIMSSHVFKIYPTKSDMRTLKHNKQNDYTIQRQEVWYSLDIDLFTPTNLTSLLGICSTMGATIVNKIDGHPSKAVIANITFG